jgi:hypothetical protein
MDLLINIKILKYKMKKKIIILMLLLLSISTNAREIDYYSNFTSYKRLVDNTWTDWSDWEYCHHKITITEDSITINKGTETEIYMVETEYEVQKDSNSETFKFKVIDDYERVLYIRLRFQYNGVAQLYIDYDDVVYAYNLI